MLKEAEKSTSPRGNLDGYSLRKQGEEEKEKVIISNRMFAFLTFIFYHFILVKKNVLNQ